MENQYESVKKDDPPLNQIPTNRENNAGYAEFLQNKKTGQTPVFSIIFWFLIFPPIGFYLLWKEKKLHIWFANSLIIFGFLNIIPILPMLFFVFPKLSKLYRELGVGSSKNTAIYLSLAILIISLSEIVAGFFFRKKIEGEGYLKNSYVTISASLFISQFILLCWLVQSATAAFILPTYEFTSHL